MTRFGVWKHAGMSGVVIGLDLTEAMASLPDSIDRDFARKLFLAGELPWLKAVHAKTKSDDDKES